MSLTATAPAIVPSITDTEAAPLTSAEGNALLGLSAQGERKPAVFAGQRTDRAWVRAGNVD